MDGDFGASRRECTEGNYAIGQFAPGLNLVDKGLD